MRTSTAWTTDTTERQGDYSRRVGARSGVRSLAVKVEYHLALKPLATGRSIALPGRDRRSAAAWERSREQGARSKEDEDIHSTWARLRRCHRRRRHALPRTNGNSSEGVTQCNGTGLRAGQRRHRADLRLRGGHPGVRVGAGAGFRRLRRARSSGRGHHPTQGARRRRRGAGHHGRQPLLPVSRPGQRVRGQAVRRQTATLRSSRSSTTTTSCPGATRSSPWTWRVPRAPPAAPTRGRPRTSCRSKRSWTG